MLYSQQNTERLLKTDQQQQNSASSNRSNSTNSTLSSSSASPTDLLNNNNNNNSNSSAATAAAVNMVHSLQQAQSLLTPSMLAAAQSLYYSPNFASQFPNSLKPLSSIL